MNKPQHDFPAETLKRNRRHRARWKEGFLERLAIAAILIASWVNAVLKIL
jgi:hypothetical protein